MRDRGERRKNTWRKIKYRERIIKEVYDADGPLQKFRGHNLHKHNLTCNCYWCHIEYVGLLRYKEKRVREFVRSHYA